jgi:hypothetical protein
MIFWGLKRGLSLGSIPFQPCRLLTLSGLLPTYCVQNLQDSQYWSMGSVLPLNGPEVYKLEVHFGRYCRVVGAQPKPMTRERFCSLLIAA